MAPLYDVFLSHSNADKVEVEALAQKLRAEKINPFLDKWNLVPGEPWQEGLEEALDRSRTCAVFVGPKGLGPWQNEEMRAALDERARNKKFRVILVLLPGAPKPKAKKLPRFLRLLTWVDFKGGLNDEDAFQRLVHGIRGTPPGPIGGGLTLPEAEKPRLRKGLLWLGLAVAAACLAILVGRFFLARRSHVFLLVPGRGIFEHLPKVSDPAPGPGDTAYDLRINRRYTSHDLRRQPIYLGAPDRLAAAVDQDRGARWVAAVEEWSGRSLTAGEKQILAEISEETPLPIQTDRLSEKGTVEVEILRLKNGESQRVFWRSFTINARHSPQPIFLVKPTGTDTQNEVP